MAFWRRGKSKEQKQLEEQGYISRSQGEMIWRAFRRHRVGRIGLVVVLVLLTLSIFADFFSPYSYKTQFNKYTYTGPSILHFRSEDGFSLRPFVYRLDVTFDSETFERLYIEDTSKRYYLSFFVRGEPYRLLGVFPTNVHFFGVRAEDGSDDAMIYMFGADRFGRDVLSRTLIGGRVSMAVGPLVLLIIVPIAIVMGGLSGYYGGGIDMFMQRLGEVFMAIPGLPILLVLGSLLAGMGLSATIRFLGIIASLSLISWAGMARVIRGQVLALREMDFVTAAKSAGANDMRIILRHIIPNITSYLIVAGTLIIPGMMLTEAALSFLGFGIQEPMSSWGQLLNQANNIASIERAPWLLVPGIFIVVSVLAFNFLGDALRDAVDPFSIV